MVMMMEIFKVTICKYDSIEKTDFSYRYIKNIKSCHEIFCIKNDDEFIDIDTNKKYYLIKTDKSGIILKEEYGHIELNTDYAINYSALEYGEKTFDLIIKAIKAKRLCKKQQKVLKR